MHGHRVWQGSIQTRGLNMQFAVWITLSNGGRSRFGVYQSQTEADGIAWVVGGVVELV